VREDVRKHGREEDMSGSEGCLTSLIVMLNASASQGCLVIQRIVNSFLSSYHANHNGTISNKGFIFS
jgi:hypothetical protein